MVRNHASKALASHPGRSDLRTSNYAEAAVVTMAGDADVEAVKAKLNGMGGNVDNFKVPDDSAQKLDDAKDVPPPDTSDDDDSSDADASDASAS